MAVRREADMMNANRLWLGVAIGVLGACGGSDFSSEATGSGGATGTAGTTGAGGNTTVGQGGAGTTGTAGSNTSGSGGRGGTSGGSGGTGAGGGGGSGGGGSRDSGTSDGSARDGTVDPCPGLRADLDAKLALAQACVPNDPTQCQVLVEGVCCPKVPVALGDSQATTAYNAALDKYRSANCLAFCTQVLCQMGPTFCQASGMGAGGTCVFGLAPPPP
jgi:hypothetical protein